MKRVWVLGAPDPEMELIEQLLREVGETVVYATVGGARVTAAQAYGAWEMPEAWGHEVYLVECDPARTGHLRRGPGVLPYEQERDDPIPDPADERPVLRALIDHHRPGDPGYGRPPAEFLPASSVGQVLVELARLRRLPSWPEEGYGVLTAQPVGTFRLALAWQIGRCVVHGSEACTHGDWWIITSPMPTRPLGGDPFTCPATGQYIPQELIFAAAADHCLAAAYRGECPGVDPDALMRWRAESRAAFQGRSVETAPDGATYV